MVPNPSRINGRIRASVLTAAMLLGTMAGARAHTASTLLPVGGSPAYVNGASLAWLDGAFDHDIGINPNHPSWGCAYNSAHMEQYMRDMHNMRMNVVRIWLFENLEGLQFDSNGYVSGLDPTFKTNIQDVVRLAQKYNLHCYFTLTSTLSNTSKFNIVTDSTARSAYLNNAVTPLVTMFKGSNQIFAYDVMNECESDVTGSTGNWSTTGTDWTTMRSFIAANASAIHTADPGRLVTSTSGWHAWSNVQAGRFSGLGLDFYDIHVYADDGYLPDASALKLDKPVIVGEYGQNTNTWSDPLQYNNAVAMTSHARDRGYAGGLIWDYGSPGSTEVFVLVNSDASRRPACGVLTGFNPDAPSPTTLYDWEDGTLQGWTGSNVSGGPWNSTSWTASGTHCLQANVSLSDGGQYYLGHVAPVDLTGTTSLRVDVSRASWGNYGTGLWAKLYVKVGTSWQWYDGGSVSVPSSGAVTLNLDLTHVPNLNQVDEVGVQFTVGTGASSTGTLYIDDVQAVKGLPPVSSTSIVSASSTTSPYTAPVAVSLSGLDMAGAAVASSYYSLDDGYPQLYSAPFTIDSVGKHKLLFWSIDSAGYTELPQTQSIEIGSPGYVDVTSQTSILRGSVLPNLSGGGYYQIVTVTNSSASPIVGPVEMTITGLPSGVTVTNAAGTFNGSPYIAVAPSGSIVAPSTSIKVRISYSNPNNKRLSYTSAIYSGKL